MSHSAAYAFALAASRLATACRLCRGRLLMGGINARLMRAVLRRPQRILLAMRQSSQFVAGVAAAAARRARRTTCSVGSVEIRTYTSDLSCQQTIVCVAL